MVDIPCQLRRPLRIGLDILNALEEASFISRNGGEPVAAREDKRGSPSTAISHILPLLRLLRFDKPECSLGLYRIWVEEIYR
jgi:hypothetical protein